MADMNVWLDIVSWAVRNGYYYLIDSLGNGDYQLTCRSVLLVYNYEDKYLDRKLSIKEFYNPNNFDFR